MCHLQKLYAKYNNKGLVILGFNASDDKKIALEMMADNKVTFPNIIDASTTARKTVFQDYQRGGSTAVPMSYVIGRDGKIVAGWYGFEKGEPKAIAAFKEVGGELAAAVLAELQAKAAKQGNATIADALKALKKRRQPTDADRDKEPAKKPEATEPAKKPQSDDAVAVTAAAQKLFKAIRDADYDYDWEIEDDWTWFPAKNTAYAVDRDHPGWVQWICRNFKENPITDIQLGDVTTGDTGLPTVHFTLRLKNKEVLEGDLPFQWDDKKKQWIGLKGLDWHLPDKRP